MNKMTYIWIGAVVLIIIAILVFVGGAVSEQSSQTAASTQTTVNLQSTTAISQNSSTTSTTTVKSTGNNTYKSTTTMLPSNSIVTGARPGCTAADYFGCTNASYSVSSNSAMLTLRITQNTGTSWSGFGVGFAPNGTGLNGGIPAITFYTSNASSTSNVGTGLASASPITLQIPVKSSSKTALGMIWVCYVNSGILYVGNGCTTSGSIPATYEVVGVVNLTSG